MESEYDRVVERRLEVGEESEEGVYRVERRKRKVSCSYTADFVQYTLTISEENGVFGAVGRV